MIESMKELRSASVKLQKAVKEIANTGFDPRWIELILRRKTGVGILDIRAILWHLEDFERLLFPPEDDSDE